MPEIVTHDLDGLLFEPGDHEALARHLTALASDRPLARRLAQQGLVTLEQRFSLHAQAREVEAVFDRLG